MTDVLRKATRVPVGFRPTPDTPSSYALGQMTSLRNAWFAVAHASAVKGKKPLARTLYGTPIVLWRGPDGSITAMEDRCAHRRTPLSAGRVRDDGLQCGYHGWTYDASGICVRIPSLGPGCAPPEKFCVETYPTVVRYGYVWLWWGDPKAADPGLVPDVPFLRPEGSTSAFEGTYMYDTSSDLLVENLIDLTHLDFVHGWLLGDPFGGAEQITVTNTDEVLTMQRRSPNRRPPKAQAPVFGFPKSQDITQTSRVHLRSNVVVGAIWYRPPGWGIAIVLPNTPETATRTRNDYIMYVTGPRWYQRMIRMVTPLIGWQDNGILKRQTPAYHELAGLSEGRADRSSSGDAASLRYRALRKALVERQQRGDFGYAAGWQEPPTEEALETPRVW
jgi:phenylpropionate dioxygenase-like ring-hydroxylating dioxygenase large terminal subunit